MTVERMLEQLALLIEEQVETADGWADRVVTVIAVVMAAVESDPQRAWRCLVDPVDDRRRVGDARRALRDRLAATIEHGAPEAGDDRSPGSWASVGVGRLWELAVQRLTTGDDGVGIDDVAGSVAFVLLAPRLGAAEARRRVLSGPRPSQLDVRWPHG